MKPYILAYKSGASTPTVDSERVVYWYRPTPKDTRCSNDNVGLPRGVELLEDVVFASTMLTQPGQLTVTSGNRGPVTIDVPAGIHTFNFTMGVGDQKFSVSRNGQTLFGGTGGLQIKDSCVTYNYNAYVGSFPSSGGGTPPPPVSSPPASSSNSPPPASSTSSKPSSTSTTLKTTTTPKPSSTTTSVTPPPTSSPSSGGK